MRILLREVLRRRRSAGTLVPMLRTGGTILATVAVVAVALGLVVTRDSPERPRAPAAVKALPLPTPHSIVRHGVGYRVAASSPSGVIGRPGSRTVTVYAMDVERRDEPVCSVLDPQVRLVAETASTVRIATFVYEIPPRRGEPRTCSYVTTGSQTLLAARRLRLSRPLGRRALVDARSGKQLGLLDSSYVPTPTYVPAGYRQISVSHYTPRDMFQAMRQFSRGTSTLKIHVLSEPWSPRGRLLGHARIGAAAGRVSEESYQRCVSWSQRGGLVAEVCSLAGGGHYLAVSELLRVARTVT